MVRRSLIAAALLAVSTPLAAQEEGWTWTSERPDGTAPIAIFGARTLAAGAIEFEYQYVQSNLLGVWSGKDSLDLATVRGLYEVAPLKTTDRRHVLGVALGLSDRLTLRARGQLAFMEREQIRNDNIFYITSASALGDAEVDVTFNVLQLGGYRIDVNGGVILPAGKSAVYAETPYTGSGSEEVLPYDMRPGAGSFGLKASASADVQNEMGSLGAQFKLRTYVNESSRGFTMGDRYEANGWAALVLHENFSVSSGFRWERWGNIDGDDRDLVSILMRDPMNNALFMSGRRVSLPIGFTYVGPDGTSIASHRFALEALFALHHDYDGPQIGLDWGFSVGYTVPF